MFAWRVPGNLLSFDLCVSSVCVYTRVIVNLTLCVCVCVLACVRVPMDISVSVIVSLLTGAFFHMHTLRLSSRPPVRQHSVMRRHVVCRSLARIHLRPETGKLECPSAHPVSPSRSCLMLSRLNKHLGWHPNPNRAGRFSCCKLLSRPAPYERELSTALLNPYTETQRPVSRCLWLFQYWPLVFLCQKSLQN